MKSNNLILCSAVFFILVFVGSGLAGPELSIPEPEFNFGYAPQTAKISHDFWLYSTGTDTLKIVKVDPG